MRMYGVGIVLLVVSLSGILFSCGKKPVASTGLHHGQLLACQPSTNCVSSQSDDPNHFTEPLIYTVEPTLARKILLDTLARMPEAKITTWIDQYIHVDFAGSLFRPGSDMDLLFDDAKKTIHLRLAARGGGGNISKTRSRIEDLRKRFAEAEAESKPGVNATPIRNLDNKFFEK